MDRIRKELPAKFPNAPLPASDAATPAAITYAYLKVAIAYDFQFTHSRKPLRFKASNGQKTEVHAFGICEEDKDRTGDDSYRKQVQVLFQKDDTIVVDLSHNTKPYQIVLAQVDRQPSLNSLIADVNKKIALGKQKGLSDDAVLLVPNMNWRVEHRFTELQGKKIVQPTNLGGSFDKIYQFVQFKMDRKGATVSSVVEGNWWSNGPDHDRNHLIFDRPFLIMLKKRGGEQPFFVMWVDNAELLLKY